jgi:hypothetical protein
MATETGWEAAFVAMSVALGASVDEAFASLDPAAAARAEGFARALAHPAREARAKALAAGLARIAVAIEKARLE